MKGKQMENKMREDFEKWHKENMWMGCKADEDAYVLNDRGHYNLLQVQVAWRGWQGAMGASETTPYDHFSQQVLRLLDGTYKPSAFEGDDPLWEKVKQEISKLRNNNDNLEGHIQHLERVLREFVDLEDVT